MIKKNLPLRVSMIVSSVLFAFVWQGVCTEAGMYALRERRVHVNQEDFEMAVAKVLGKGFYSRFKKCPNVVLCISLVYHSFSFHRWCRKTTRKTCPSRNSGNRSRVSDLPLFLCLQVALSSPKCIRNKLFPT